MPVWNPNKLFPRLSIRTKLGIAFVLLPLGPLAIIALATTQVTVDRLRTVARTTLQLEVNASQTEVERALRQVEQDVIFLADAFLAVPLGDGKGPEVEARRALAEFLNHAPFLFRVKTVNEDGLVLYESGGSLPDGAEGYYYALRGAELTPLQRLLLPVEVRTVDPVNGMARAIPAVAVLVPVFRPDGSYAGVVIGEAYAATLFASIEQVAQLLPGAITGLLDPDGRLLYHSQQKRDWESLFGQGLGTELSARLADAPASSEPFQISGYLASSELVHLGSANQPPLKLFRAVALSDIDAPVQEFLGWVGVTGVATMVMVIGLALAGARQITQPIYQLQAAAAQLARGQNHAPLRIDTNDELEDLALDFESMAQALTENRQTLERIVAERTRELQATHAELSDLLARSADAIVGLDPDGGIRVWNRGAEKLFGYSSEEVVGLDADTVLLRQDRDSSAERLYLNRELRQHGALIDYHTRRQAKDGRLVPVSLTATVVEDSTGRRVGTSLIMRDTTLQTTLEQHMRRSERLAAMSVMAAGLAHEINNPIAIIGNRIEVMEAELQGTGHETLLSDLGVLRDHTNRLASLTRDLLRFARDPEEHQGPTELTRIAARVAGLVERTLAGRNIQLKLNTDDDTTVYGSEVGLETVVLNLVLNAADAMPAGGTIAIDVNRHLKTVRLTVTDEGPGVPEELRERIFEPFFTTKDAQRGTGLGLSLCRSVVERHGGSILVERANSGGARFVVAVAAYEGEST